MRAEALFGPSQVHAKVPPPTQTSQATLMLETFTSGGSIETWPRCVDEYCRLHGIDDSARMAAIVARRVNYTAYNRLTALQLSDEV